MSQNDSVQNPCSGLDHLHKWHQEQLDDHESRLRDIEKAQARLSAIVAIAAGLGSILGGTLLKGFLP